MFSLGNEIRSRTRAACPTRPSNAEYRVRVDRGSLGPRKTFRVKVKENDKFILLTFN